MKGKIKMIGKRKLGVKLVAVIISMLMVFQILPLTAFANEYQNNLYYSPQLIWKLHMTIWRLRKK